MTASADTRRSEISLNGLLLCRPCQTDPGEIADRDYLILLSRGRVQVAGEIDGLLASHRMLTGEGVLP